MKDFKEFIREAAETQNYEVGQSVKFILDQVTQYIEPDTFGGMNYGTITVKGTNSYDVRLPNGNIVKIKAEDIYAYGNADID